MKENDRNINIENEQNKIIHKINKIQESGVFVMLGTCLNKFKDKFLDPLQDKNINIYGRLKKASSASNKIAQKNISSNEIYDLIAFMLVVDLPENYKNMQTILMNKLYGLTYSRLFAGDKPENNGYSSLHLGIDVNTFLKAFGIKEISDLYGLSAEVQLKTYGMYMAQEATHDSIYKNDRLTTKEKFEIQSLMFPIIEHLTNIEMYENTLKATVNPEERISIEEKISKLKEVIEKHKQINAKYINENMDLVEIVFKEYVARKSIEKLKRSINSELSVEQTERLISTYRNAINYLSSSQGPDILGDTEPTGFKNIDELLAKVEDKSFNEMMSLSNCLQYPNSLLDSIVNISKKSVTLNDMNTAIDELQQYIYPERNMNGIEQNK